MAAVATLERAKKTGAPPADAKGTNTSFVSVGIAPGGEVTEVEVTRTMTVREAFQEAGMKVPKGHELQKSGRKAKLTDKVKPGDTVLAVAKVRGG